MVKIANKYEIVFESYETDRGKNYYQDYLDSLPETVSSKLIVLIKQIEQFGLYQAMTNRWVEKLDSNIYEVRKEYGKLWHRLLFFRDTERNINVYIFTHGFSKKSNKTPKREIDRANAIRKKYFEMEYGKKV